MKQCIAVLLAALMLPLSGCANWDAETFANDPLGELSQYYQTDTEDETPSLTTFALPCLSGETLDPITCGDGIQLTLSPLLYEPLYQLSPQFEPEALLAQSALYEQETFTYTIQLRSGICFSDGTPLTASDVAATLLRAQESARYAARLADVVSIRAEDSSTVVIQLIQDHRSFTSLLDIPIIKAGTEMDAFPVGTGPYVKSEQSDTLCRNSHWWRSVSLPFTEIELISYKSEDAAAYAFSSHDIHLLAYDMTGTGANIASTSGSYTDADTTILHYLGFNLSRWVFQDETLRQAVSMLIDRSAIVSAYLMGHGVETQFPVHPSSTLYPVGLEDTDTADEYATVMAELGMADGEDVYDLTLLVNSENSFKVSAAQEIADTLNQYDFNVTVRTVPWEEYLSALSEGHFDLYYGECRLTADWDITELVGTGGSLNYGGYSDPLLDVQLSACLSADGAEQRSSTLEALCRRLKAYMPIVPICFKRTSVLLPRDAVEAITPTAANPFYGFDRWVVNWSEPDENGKN